MNLPKLIEDFGSEDRCRGYLEELRWPDGIVCPRCGGNTMSRIRKRNQFDCDSCRYQFSVTAGTLFHDSHLPLWKWFLAVYLICESKKGISSKQLQRTLGVSYKTAWYVSHRIRAAMGEVEEFPLVGEMEFRFNNRDNPFLFRDTLLVLLHGETLPYRKLVDKPGPRRATNRKPPIEALDPEGH
jgi:transposase-like protein